jgi:predicted dehydrogenase
MTSSDRPAAHSLIRVGVIGVGYLGQHHARIYSQLPNVTLVGVADTVRERADDVAKAARTRAFYNPQALLDQVDAVSIVVPTVAHFETAGMFLERGIHVMLEKPMTRTLAEADRLIELAQKSKVVLQVGHLERFNSAIRKLAGMICEPRFAEVHRLGGFAARVTDVDVVLDLMIHDIDILLSLVASDVYEIRAAGTQVISNSIDIANARIEFKNGCVANVTASRVSREPMRKIRIFQPDAYFSLDYKKQELVMARRARSPERTGFFASLKRRTLSLAGLPGIVIERIKMKKEEPLKAELESFIQTVRSGEKPIVSGREGREALKVALQVMEQIQMHTSRAQNAAQS